MENSIVNLLNLQHTCTACLTESNLIEINEDQENLMENYKRITIIDVKEIRNYPYWFCRICINKIHEYNEFRETCLQSYNTLKNVVKPAESFIKIDTNTTLIKDQTKSTKTDGKFVENPLKSRSTKCMICLEMFNTNEELLSHSNNQHNTDDYKCNHCQETFKYPNLLTEHMRNHNTIIENNYKFACNRCDKSYTSIANLQLHINSHLGVKPFKCAICLKNFTKKTSLKTHLITHSNVKHHLCSECGEGFSTSALLHQHQFKHNGINQFSVKSIHELTLFCCIGLSPYGCPHCSARCRSASDLTVHIRTHTGERPYLCSTCGKSFKRCTYFKAHKRIHTGEKPYQCSICTKAFTQSCDLRSHSRIHTGERPYCCAVCNKRFIQHSALSTHLKRRHKQVESV